MQLVRRKRGSSRTSQPKAYVFTPNYGGQGGSTSITLESGDDYLTIILAPSEYKELLSQAHTAYHNYQLEQHIKDTVKQWGLNPTENEE